ncbi:uncharacterized protein RHOBADRAFT_52447, partial [Rhodotorula graminis WP1]
ALRPPGLASRGLRCRVSCRPHLPARLRPAADIVSTPPSTVSTNVSLTPDIAGSPSTGGPAVLARPLPPRPARSLSSQAVTRHGIARRSPWSPSTTAPSRTLRRLPTRPSRATLTRTRRLSATPSRAPSSS